MVAAIAVAALSVASFAVAFESSAARSSCKASATELIRMGDDFAQQGEDSRAIRMMTEALDIDKNCGEAYLKLGALRMHSGDPREAERVYTVALANAPEVFDAYKARAYAALALGRLDDGTADMKRYAALVGVNGKKALAEWYGHVGWAPAQLAVWRSIAAEASDRGDEALRNTSAIFVSALQLIVGPADPVTNAKSRGLARTAIARLATSKP